MILNNLVSVYECMAGAAEGDEIAIIFVAEVGVCLMMDICGPITAAAQEPGAIQFHRPILPQANARRTVNPSFLLTSYLLERIRIVA